MLQISVFCTIYMSHRRIFTKQFSKTMFRKIVKIFSKNKENQIKSHFDNISNEVIVEILSFLDEKSMKNAFFVCKRYKNKKRR